MSLRSTHPSYDRYLPDWHLMRDVISGQRAVKDKNVEYLSPTSGQIEDGGLKNDTDGFAAYKAYLRRAYFPHLTLKGLNSLLGIMHSKPPVFELPPQMEPLLESATLRGETLQQLLYRINEEQITTGRIGLLADMPSTRDPERGDIPYIATYTAESIINWDSGQKFNLRAKALNLVVLNESGFERTQNFEWEQETAYRVLILGDVLANEENAIYRQGQFKGTDVSFDESQLMEPSLLGNTLNFIPFTFINTKDIVDEPDNPPLIGLANLNMAIYQGEADYRQNLFMQAQDTLVIIGGNLDDQDVLVRVGANAVLHLPANATAEYIGVDSQGLPEQRQALENDYNRAQQEAANLLEKSDAESGDALRVRVASKTATLTDVAVSGGYGLQNSLRQIALWMGLDAELVVVKPNLDFVDDTMSGQEAVQLTTAHNMGAPLSRESIHGNFQRRGLTKLSYEEELQKLEDEPPSSGSTNPAGPANDPDDENADT